MSLQTDIETAMRAAMKAGDARRVSTLRMAMAAAHNRQIELGLYQAYDYASEVMTRNMMAFDAEEGIEAFLQKRKPNWKGR